MVPSRLSPLRALEAALRVSRLDLQLACGMLIYQFLVVSTFITGRTVRDTLFLRRVSPEDLPAMYILSAACVALAGVFYSRVADRIRRDRASRFILGAAAGSMLLIWGAIRGAPQGEILYVVLYVLVEVLGSLCIIQFWTTANDIFSSQQSKRLFGFIGAGGVLANIVCGVGVGGLSWSLGPVNLLVLNALLFACASMVVSWIGQRATVTLEDAIQKPTKRSLGRSPSKMGQGHGMLLRAIGGSVAITFVVVTLVDFQFKITARESFSDEAALASFFGYFYGVTGVAAAGVQLFLTGRILTRAGVVAGLSVLPMAMLGGATIWLIIPGVMFGAAVMRGAENVFRYTIHDATLHLLYVPIPGNQRGRAKAFIDGVIKPSAIGGCGVALFTLAAFYPPTVIAAHAIWVDITLLLVWLVIVIRIRKGYVRSLAEALETRRLEPDTTRDLVDEDTRSILSAHLDSEDPGETIHVLELIGELQIDMRADFLRLADHESPEIRARSLALLEPLRSFEAKVVATRRIDDVDPRVRSAAVRCLSAIDREGIRLSMRLLSDNNRRVKGAAVAAIARYGDFEGLLTAARTLESMLASNEDEDREIGASIISEVRWADFFSTINRLLADPSVRVRRAAIHAAGRIGGSDVLLPLIGQLSDDDTAGAAIHALAQLGPDAQGPLLKVLAQSAEDLRIRRRVPRVLASWGDWSAYEALLGTLDTKDPELRTACARALARIRERHPGFALPLDRWSSVLDREIRGIARDRKAAKHVASVDATLLQTALRERATRRLERVGDLFVLRYPGESLRAAFVGLRSPNVRTRGQAWELLENVIDRDRYQALQELVEDAAHPSSRPQPLVMTQDLDEPESEIRRLAREPAGWVAAVALEWVGRCGRGAQDLELVLERTNARDPLIREAALYAAFSLARRSEVQPDDLAHTFETASSDRNTVVSAAAVTLLEEFRATRSYSA